MNMSKPPSRTEWYKADLELEKELDSDLETRLKESEASLAANALRIAKAVESVSIIGDEFEDAEEDERHSDENDVDGHTVNMEAVYSESLQKSNVVGGDNTENGIQLSSMSESPLIQFLDKRSSQTSMDSGTDV